MEATLIKSMLGTKGRSGENIEWKSILWEDLKLINKLREREKERLHTRIASIVNNLTITKEM